MKHLLVVVLVLVSMFSVSCGKKKNDQTNLGPGYTNNPNHPNNWYNNPNGGGYAQPNMGPIVSEAPTIENEIDTITDNEVTNRYMVCERELSLKVKINANTLYNSGLSYPFKGVIVTKLQYGTTEVVGDPLYLPIFSYWCAGDICNITTEYMNPTYARDIKVKVVDAFNNESPESEVVTCYSR